MKVENNSASALENLQNSQPTEIFILYSMTFVFVLVANSMLIYGFYKTSRPFTVVTKLFVYLSICDVVQISCLLLGGASLRLLFSFKILYFVLFICIVYIFSFIPSLAFWTILFLRFLSIYKPMYRVKTRTVNKILMVELLISVICGSIIFSIFILGDQTINDLMKVNKHIYKGLQLVVVSVNLSLNMSSLILLRRSTNSKARQAADNVSINNKMVIKQKKKALHTLMLITGFHLMCSAPFTGLSLMKFEMIFVPNFSWIFTSCQCFLFSYAGINSLVVIFRTKDLRQFYAMKCCRESSRN